MSGGRGLTQDVQSAALQLALCGFDEAGSGAGDAASGGVVGQSGGGTRGSDVHHVIVRAEGSQQERGVGVVQDLVASCPRDERLEVEEVLEAAGVGFAALPRHGGQDHFLDWDLVGLALDAALDAGDGVERVQHDASSHTPVTAAGGVGADDGPELGDNQLEPVALAVRAW